jgi:LCP family protein required for cell wall assembly
MRRRVRWGRLVGVVLGLAVLGAAAYGYHYYATARSSLLTAPVVRSNPGPFRNRVTILLLGEGLVQAGNRDIKNPKAPDQTDTMMLVSLDPKTGQAGVISIPRDTLVDLPQAGGRAKINDANFVGGPQLAVKVVEKTLGVPVDYYLETTIWNFPKIVDALGGLTVDVPYPMHYGSATGAGSYLNINLNPGVQHLDGQQVLEFVRFRQEALGDIGRIQQQQYILRLILKKLLTPQEISKLPEVIGMLRQDITATNLSTQQMLALGLWGAHVNVSAVRFATLPGAPATIGGIDYWVLDRHLLRPLIDDVLLDRFTPSDRAALHVVVRSGTMTLAGAEAVARWLRRQGFAVGPVVWANRHDHRTSTVVDYTGDKYLAGRLAAALGGVKTVSVEEVPYHDVPGVDLVVTTGTDLHLNPRSKL